MFNRPRHLQSIVMGGNISHLTIQGQQQLIYREIIVSFKLTIKTSRSFQIE